MQCVVARCHRPVSLRVPQPLVGMQGLQEASSSWRVAFSCGICDGFAATAQAADDVDDFEDLKARAKAKQAASGARPAARMLPLPVVFPSHLRGARCNPCNMGLTELACQGKTLVQVSVATHNPSSVCLMVGTWRQILCRVAGLTLERLLPGLTRETNRTQVVLLLGCDGRFCRVTGRTRETNRSQGVPSDLQDRKFGRYLATTIRFSIPVMGGLWAAGFPPVDTYDEDICPTCLDPYVEGKTCG
jgi:hypothetical protein